MAPQVPRISPNDIIQQIKLSCQIPAVASAILERQIILSKAQELGLDVEKSELQKAADSFRLQHKLVSAQETVAWLQHHMLSLEDLEVLVYETVLRVQLAEHLFASKVESFFVDRKLDYMQVVLHEAVLENPDLAMELFYALQEQEIIFPEVARHHHFDPEVRRRSGYRGLVKRQDLGPEISAAVFEAKPPQILPPITVARKTYLLWVEDIVQPTLTEELRFDLLMQLFTHWLRQQVLQFDISKVLDLAVAG